AILNDVVTALYQQVECPKEISAPLPFAQSIALQHVRTRYPGAAQDVLQDITLQIPKGSTTGFIGTTGSGKSTLLDVIMGLLPPIQGQLLVDGVAIDSTNIRAWQQNIAHVSQSIFLSDTSIEENIAFGVPANKIDFERVQRAAQQAQIHPFIETLPKGYQTWVGERGVRLSGGQRQRIGIARALYKQALVLVLDEATSALDEETEKVVMESINALGDVTLLIIAHRLSTLERCDRIVKLADGLIAEHNS
ncbi:MAG: ATP-binding cassette domain-containing protein, partial [Candidatus Electrothrix sp. LOE1_4_5]|nr:ATP-binding cassette domain-containing protein [Candidatus Electrothrix gigas]